MKKSIGKGILMNPIYASVGSSILSGIGGTAAEKGNQGISNMANAFPAMGTIAGAGLVLGSLNTLRSAVPKAPYNYQRTKQARRAKAIRYYNKKRIEAAISD